MILLCIAALAGASIMPVIALASGEPLVLLAMPLSASFSALGMGAILAFLLPADTTSALAEESVSGGSPRADIGGNRAKHDKAIRRGACEPGLDLEAPDLGSLADRPSDQLGSVARSLAESGQGRLPGDAHASKGGIDTARRAG